MPAERWLLTNQDTDAQPERQIAQAILVLRLRRAGWPFLLVDDVTEVMQLGGWDRIVALDDLSVGAPEPNHATIGRVRRERVEAGGADVPPDLLEISARGAPSTQAEIEDELIDVRAHAVRRGLMS